MQWISRRAFVGTSARALLGARVRSFAQVAGSGQRPVGYAAVGLGTISNIFMRGCAASQAAKVAGLVTGHPDTKGKQYGQIYAVPDGSLYTYETFDRIRDNKAVEAVYIGLPNSMHCEYTIRAAQAGKHVLCEKPMAISSSECRRMIDACKAAGVKLMIAYRVHYDPIHLQAQQLIKSGAIGELQAFEGAFGFNAAPNQWRLVRKLAGGGSLMDVGIYPLNETRWLTGEEPVSFTAMPTTRDRASGRFAEMEQTLDFAVKFPSGIVGAFACTYGSDMPGFLRIHGDRGSLRLSPAFNYTGTHLMSLSGREHVDAASPENDDSYQFKLEAEHFANCVRTNAEPKTPGEEGLKDMLAIEAIYKAAGTPIA
jgi:predicted dehydrogenase